MARREGIKKGVYVLPNFCTSASLFCGFFSVIQSLKGDFVAAAWAVLVAGLFDFLDGRIARLTHAESEFGMEYDSLVDLASFGLAPSVLVYTWTLQTFEQIGWLAAFFYFACGALRLARFNVQSDNEERCDFQGLPIPVAAYTLATFVIFHSSKFGVPPFGNYVTLFLTLALSLLMVSNIRYRSFKQIDFQLRRPFFALVGAIIGIFVIAAHPKVTMFILVSAYVVMGLVEEILHLRRRIDKTGDSQRGGADLVVICKDGKVCKLPKQSDGM